MALATKLSALSLISLTPVFCLFVSKRVCKVTAALVRRPMSSVHLAPEPACLSDLQALKVKLGSLVLLSPITRCFSEHKLKDVSPTNQISVACRLPKAFLDIYWGLGLEDASVRLLGLQACGPV